MSLLTINNASGWIRTGDPSIPSPRHYQWATDHPLSVFLSVSVSEGRCACVSVCVYVYVCLCVCVFVCVCVCLLQSWSSNFRCDSVGNYSPLSHENELLRNLLYKKFSSIHLINLGWKHAFLAANSNRPNTYPKFCMLWRNTWICKYG